LMEGSGVSRISDIICPMYASHLRTRALAESGDKRPVILCEYAHAMGNSTGGALVE
jgi:beta-galactosidase